MESFDPTDALNDRNRFPLLFVLYSASHHIVEVEYIQVYFDLYQRLYEQTARRPLWI